MVGTKKHDLAVENANVLTETEAAAYIGVAAITLRRQRSEGPRENRLPLVPFVRVGRNIRYRKRDLDAFLERHLVGTID